MKPSTFYKLLLALSILASLTASFWVIFGKSPFKTEADFKFFQIMIVFFVLAILFICKVFDSVRVPSVLNFEDKQQNIIKLESGDKLQINSHGCCVSCCFLPVCSYHLMIYELDYSNSPVKVTEKEMEELEIMCACNDCNYQILEK